MSICLGKIKAWVESRQGLHEIKIPDNLREVRRYMKMHGGFSREAILATMTAPRESARET